jgi:hypothetical protein
VNEESHLKKVDKSLYTETCKREDGTEFEIKWQKELEHMWLDLTGIKLRHDFEVDHPVFQEIFQGSILHRDDAQYERRELRSIEATGNLVDRDSIGIIEKNGSAKAKVFRQVKVHLRRLEGDLKKEDIEGKKVNGWLGHSEDDRHVYLHFCIPSEIFDSAYRELQERKTLGARLGVYVEVFNSEVDRSLRDYRMPMDFFIENESRNKLYFHFLSISEAITNATSQDTSMEIEDSEVPHDSTETTPPIFMAIAKNIAEVRVLLILLLGLIALRIFKIL